MIAPLSDLDADRATAFGGKAALLGAMLANGLRVFGGVALSTSCYRDALTGSGAEQPAADFWRTAAADRPHDASIATLSADVARRLDGYDASRTAEQALRVLDAQGIEAGELIVRSSATGEDSADLSYAGQFSSYRCPADRLSLAATIRQVWKSCTAPHVPLYRSAFGRTDTIEMGVVVQPYSSFSLAGLLFTSHPTVSVSGWMLLEYLDAAPSELVAGTVMPHRCRMSAEDGRLTWERRMPDRPVLSSAETDSLRSAGVELATLLGADADIEWGIRDGGLYLLQCRPTTTAPAGNRPEAYA